MPYAAGPPLMGQVARESLFARGLKQERFFSETFESMSAGVAHNQASH